MKTSHVSIIRKKNVQRETEVLGRIKQLMSVGGEEILPVIAEELDKIKPSYEEMLRDIALSGLRVSLFDGDYGALRENKKLLVDIFWKIVYLERQGINLKPVLDFDY